MTIDPSSLSERSKTVEEREDEEVELDEDAKGGHHFTDQERHTEVVKDQFGRVQEVREAEGDPKSKLERIRKAKGGDEE